MRKLFALLCVTALGAALGAALLPASAFAAGRQHHRYQQSQMRAAEPVVAADAATAPREAYAAAVVPPNPLLYPVGGAIIGAVIGAAVCPPCSIAGSALTSGGGALLGAGIGATGGAIITAATAQPTSYERYERRY